ncbi:MAG: exosortase A [Motiliproteus sp.]|jgi:exosortase A
MNQRTLPLASGLQLLTGLSRLERVLFILTFSAYLLLFWPSLSSMADIWWRSETFAHGMLVPFISLWLIWRNRHRLRCIPLGSSWLAVAAIAVGGLVWLIGIATDIAVLHQLAAVGLMLVLVPALLGWPLSQALLFPLLYLLFMVPLGEELTPALQQITADITVQALRMSGIPVYMNGLFIEIPTGRFEVAQACSGIRYLIASLAVGTLYAYLTYQTYAKRLIFIIAALLVPILANGLRAYGIVLIAHLSEMKYATGADHLIYGWLFFGLVMGLMFWVGSYWRDPEPALIPGPRAALLSTSLSTTLSTSLSTTLSTSFPTRLSTASSRRLSVSIVTLALFSLIGLATLQLKNTVIKQALDDYQIDLNDWQTDTTFANDWRPAFIGADRTLLQHFSNAEQAVGLYIGDYQSEAHNKELINQRNQINSAENWTVHSRRGLTLTLGSVQLPVRVTELRHINGAKRQVWHWFEAYDRFANNGIQIKLWQALNRLTGSAYLSSVYAIAIDYQDSLQAEQQLTGFMTANWRLILDQHAAQPSARNLREHP